MGKEATRKRSPDEGDLEAVLTAEEAAKLLKLSPRTLEKWRSEGAGPPVLRMGRRVAYARRDIVRWLAEQEARGRKESSVRDELEVTSRPYFKDRTRQHVDINFAHPLDPEQPVRRRIVAPVGMDAVAATEWGRAEAFKFYRELCQRPIKVDNVEQKEGENPKQPSVNTVKTLEEFWPEFLAGHVAELKQSSRDGYDSAWAFHLQDRLGPLKLDAIDEQVLSKLRKHMRQELKLSLSYTRQICEKVCTVLRYAQSEGVLKKSHAIPELTWAKQRRPKVEVYSREQLERFIAAGTNDEARLLHLLLTDGALRIGECAGLMWKDINFEARTMEISRCVSRGKLQDTAKGEDGTVPLSPRLLEALRTFRPRGNFIFAGDGAYSAHSFPAKGEFVTENTLGQRARRAQEAAGLPVYGPHRIRHSVLTLLAAQGVSPYALQAFARHARMATTMKYYIHLNQAELASQAVSVLSNPDAFGNAKATRGNNPEFTLLT